MQLASLRRLRTLHWIADTLYLAGIFSGMVGTYWDMQYHLDVGRDSFWITPHLFIYAGVALVFLASLALVYKAGQLHPRHVARNIRTAFLLILAASIAELAAAPIDDLWHRVFGIDTTVWSPPHFLLIGAGFVGIITLAYFQRSYMRILREERIKRLIPDQLILELTFAFALMALVITLGEFEYMNFLAARWPAHPSTLRPPELYLILVTLAYSFVFTLAKIVSRRTWTATRIALFYIFIRMGISLVLSTYGSWPMWPALVLIPAIVFDLVLKKTKLHQVVLATFFGGIAFYVGEYLYLTATNASRYIPRTLIEVFTAADAAILIALVAFFLGRFMAERIRSLETV